MAVDFGTKQSMGSVAQSNGGIFGQPKSHGLLLMYGVASLALEIYSKRVAPGLLEMAHLSIYGRIDGYRTTRSI
jgi:hypothetical protein